MKTTIDYSDKTEREAISDVLFYIGFNHFKKVVREISKYTDNEETRKSFMIGLEFAGVERRVGRGRRSTLASRRWI